MTLAGIAASDRYWTRFEKDWQAMLSHRNPPATHLHMSPLVAQQKPFSQREGWTGDGRIKFVQAAMDVLQQCPKNEFRAFVCRINVTARERLLGENCAIPDPALIAVEWVTGSAIDWHTKPNRIELINLYFDRGETFMRKIRSRWEQHRTKGRGVAKDLFWDRINEIEACDAAERPGVQAADLVAWATTRGLSERTRAWRHLAEVLVGSKERNGVFPSTQVILGEKELLEKHPAKSSSS